MSSTRQRWKNLMVFIGVFNAVVAWGRETPKMSSLSELCQSGITDQKETKYHVFDGQHIYLPFIVPPSTPTLPSPSGGGLRWGEEGQIWKVQVNQLGFSLKAPYEIKSEILSCPEKISRGAFNKLVSLEIPEIKRETVFEINIQKRDSADEDWKNLSHLELEVYPHDILKPLVAWSERVQLRLQDAEGTLAKIFEESKIAFVDSKAAFPLEEKQAVVTLFVKDPGEDLLEKREGFPGETIVIFHEEVKTLPVIKTQPYKSGTRVDVFLQLLSDLKTHPQNQRMFMDIIRLSNTLGQEGK